MPGEALCPACRAHPSGYDPALPCPGGCGGVGFLPSTDAPTVEGLASALRTLRVGNEALVEELATREDIRGPWLAGDARSAIRAAWHAYGEAVRSTREG